MMQAEALKTGFYSVVGRKNFHDITPAQLEEIICGKGEIDIDDWMKNTLYEEPYTSKHQVIQWFWAAVHTYTQDQLAKLVQFVTGTSRIPVGGFAVLESNRGNYAKFCIRQMPSSENKSPFPHAHTCFNRLTLPIYESYVELKVKFDFIIEQEVTGFGID